MFKYYKFIPVETEKTTIGFRQKDESAEVFRFDGNIVSVRGEEADIDALVAHQSSDIGLTEITQADFVELVKNTPQIENIRRQVREKIAKRYLYADEIKYLKLPDTDAGKVEYEDYVAACRADGDAKKAECGYL